MKKLLLGIFSLAAMTMGSHSYGQLSEGGTPYSFNNTVPSIQVEKVLVPTPDLNYVAAQDALNDMTKAYRVGINQPVDLKPSNSGTWQTLADGSRLWRLEIESPNAMALGLYYNNFFIPQGGRVYIYNDTKTQVLGAYTSAFNVYDKIGATQMTEGDKMIMEYYAPAWATGDPIIEIREVVHFYRGVEDFIEPYTAQGSLPTRAESCQVDVNCSPEGDNWTEQRDAVLHYTFSTGQGTAVCSASMINNTALDCKPYVLSAWHCGEPNAGSNISSWVWYYNYQKTSCAPGASNGSNPSKGTQTMTGGTVVASSGNGTQNNPPGANQVSGSDFYLVELNSEPPTAYNAYYAGWDRSNTAATSGVSIHHPAGSAKKISTFTSSLNSTTYNGGWSGAHWAVTWASTTNGHGVTEGGSSGSPIFNQNKRIVGQLSGGSSFCSTPTQSDLYGKFRNDWDMSGTANNAQLAPWLDPGNTGAMTLDGTYQPCTPQAPTCNITASSTNITVGGTVNFADGSSGLPDTWQWNFDNGGLGGASPATSTAQNPGNITFSNTGTYEVQLIATNAQGTCTTTVNVAVVASTGCDTLLNIQAADTLRLYGADGGYLAGWNNYGDLSKCEKYTNYSPYNYVNGMAIYLAVNDGGNGATVDFNIWDDNAGAPGTVIGTQQFTLAQLDAALAGNNGIGILNILYPQAVNVGGNDFYIGVTMNGFGASDSLGIVSNSLFDPTPNSAFEEWNDNTWHDIASAWGNPLSFYISPYVTDVPVSGSASSNITTTCAGGSIDYSATGTNVTGYSWTFPGGTPANSTNQNETVTYATAGSYTAYLVLEGACSGQAIDSVNVTITDGPTVTSTTTDPGCTNDDGQIVVSATGGTTPYQYSIDGGSTFQSSDTFTGLASGNYNIVVQDANGCTGAAIGTLNTPVGGLTATAATTDPGCADNDGQLVITASGSAGPFQYSIDNGTTFQSSDTFTGLSAGNYDIVVTDGTCNGNTTATLNAANTTLTVTSITSDPSCTGGDGQIVINVTGSAGPFQYSIDNGTTFQASNTFSGLNAGTFDIVVTENGCQGTAQATLNPGASSINVSTTQVNPGCGATDGSIEVTATGGTTPYQFSNDDAATYNAGTSPYTFSTLGVGNYIIAVQDADGCVSRDTVDLINTGAPTASASGTGASCFGDSDGTITVTGSGGTPALQYSIDGGTTYQASGSFSGLAAGTYNIVVQDAASCEANTSYVVTEPTQVTHNATATDASCGNPDGSIDVSAAGGSTPYTYSTDNGATSQSSGTFSALAAGSYQVIAIDASGCTSNMSSVNVGGGTAVSATAAPSNSTCNDSNGSIDITATGGSTPYQYSIDGGATFQASGTFTGLNSGTYSCVIEDAAGCQTITSATVTNVGGVNSSSSPDQDICEGNSATITASGAGSGGTYSWDNGLGSGSTHVVTPTQTTNYVCTIEDATGCTATETVMITVTPTPIVSVSPASAEICDGDALTLTASGAQTYNWIGTGQSTADITVTPSSNTTYNVIGYNGTCTSTATSVSVTVNASPTVDADADAYVIVVGGTVNFNAFNSVASSYSWNFGDGNSSTQNAPAHTYNVMGTYDVVLTGTLGNCTATDTITIIVGANDITEINLDEAVKLFPNPNNGEFTLSFDFAEMQDVEFVLHDMVGKLIETSSINNVNSTAVQFDLSSESNGFYFMTVKTEFGQITKRISVVK